MDKRLVITKRQMNTAKNLYRQHQMLRKIEEDLRLRMMLREALLKRRLIDDMTPTEKERWKWLGDQCAKFVSEHKPKEG